MVRAGTLLAIAAAAAVGASAHAQETGETPAARPGVQVIPEDFELRPNRQQTQIRRNEPMVQPLPNATQPAPQQTQRPRIELPEPTVATPSTNSPANPQTRARSQPQTPSARPTTATPSRAAPSAEPPAAIPQSQPAAVDEPTAALPSIPASRPAAASPAPVAAEEAEASAWSPLLWVLPGFLAMGLAVFGLAWLWRRRQEEIIAVEKIEPYRPPQEPEVPPATERQVDPVAAPRQAPVPGGFVQVPARRAPSPQRPVPQAQQPRPQSSPHISPDGFVTIRPAHLR